MTIAILPCRSVPLELKLLFISILLCLLAFLPAAAQEDNITCTSADLGGYAELGFCLPENVIVEPETWRKQITLREERSEHSCSLTGAG